MVTIVTRAGKGSALTWTEGDANITNLNNGKLENVVEDTTPQLGGNLDVNGNSIVSTSNGDINLTPDGTGKVVTTKTLNANILASTQSSGDEGGQLELATAATNTTLSGSVAIDIYQNKLRIFETGGSSRGAYIDLSAAATGVGTNLVGGGGIASVSADTAPALGGNLELANYSLTSDTGDGVRLASSVIFLNKTAVTGSVVLTTDQSRMDIGPDFLGNYAGGATLVLNKGTDAAITMTSKGTGNINLTPSGTGKVVAKQLNYNEGAIYDLGTTGGTIAPNVTNGNVQKITLNSALTINGFTSPVAGQSLTLIIYGGTAYTSITSTMKFAGGIKTLTGTAGCIDILSIYYDGTTYFASLGKGFA